MSLPELPEPELGYIETDKSRQPAFSARQMRAALQAQPAEVERETTARREAQEQLYAERERHTAEVKKLQAEIGKLQALATTAPVKPLFAAKVAAQKWAELQEQGHRMQTIWFDGGPGGAGTIDPWGKVTWSKTEPDVPETNFGNTTERKGEPVATVRTIRGVTIGYLETRLPDGTSLYASPQVPEVLPWKGLNLHSMAEAFEQVIEAAAHRENPFFNPITKNAQLALREFKLCIPAMQAIDAARKGE